MLFPYPNSSHIDQLEVQIDHQIELKHKIKSLDNQIHKYKSKNRSLQSYTIEKQFKSTTESKLKNDRIKLDSALKELEYTNDKLKQL